MSFKQLRSPTLPMSVLVAGLGVVTMMGALAGEDEVGAFIPKLVNSSTIPGNGDLNPYGVAFVPTG